MNKFFMIAALTLSSSAFAQTCYVDMVNRYNQVVRSYTAYDMNDGCKEGMKQCRKAIRLEPHLRGVDCIRSGYNPTPNPNPYPNPNPNPYPNPNPNPYPNPYPQYGMTASGLIEDKLFTITGADAADLYYNCLTEVRRVHYGSADELFISVNNNRFVSTSTPGWYNDSQICSIIEQEARRSVNITYTAPIRIIGDLERVPFRIEANDRASMLNACVNSFTAMRLGSTDELTYSLNGAPLRRITTTGWWSSPARACKAMILHLDNQLY